VDVRFFSQVGVSQCLPPQALGKAGRVQQGSHFLGEGAIETLCDAVQLRRVVDGESPCRSCVCEVLIESLAEVLAPLVGAQDFDGGAVLLCARPRLVPLVDSKYIALSCEQEGGRIPGGVISEGDEISSATLGRHCGWPPYIGMYLVAEIFGLLADAELGHRLSSCPSVNAGFAVLHTGIWVEGEAGYEAIVDKLVCARRSNMPHAPVQLHDADDLDGIASLLLV
jgi:hypothetical protein